MHTKLSVTSISVLDPPSITTIQIASETWKKDFFHNFNISPCFFSRKSSVWAPCSEFLFSSVGVLYNICDDFHLQTTPRYQRLHARRCALFRKAYYSVSHLSKSLRAGVSQVSMWGYIAELLLPGIICSDESSLSISYSRESL